MEICLIKEQLNYILLITSISYGSGIAFALESGEVFWTLSGGVIY
jgi:hypothetical protein